jgi:hypothetical protein
MGAADVISSRQVWCFAPTDASAASRVAVWPMCQLRSEGLTGCSAFAPVVAARSRGAGQHDCRLRARVRPSAPPRTS